MNFDALKNDGLELKLNLIAESYKPSLIIRAKHNESGTYFHYSEMSLVLMQNKQTSLNDLMVQFYWKHHGNKSWTFWDARYPRAYQNPEYTSGRDESDEKVNLLSLGKSRLWRPVNILPKRDREFFDCQNIVYRKIGVIGDNEDISIVIDKRKDIEEIKLYESKVYRLGIPQLKKELGKYEIMLGCSEDTNTLHW
jgi:hypothetical protein